MTKSRTMLRVTSLLVAAVVTIGSAGCGTILYPERRAQSAGQIDTGVAVLNGIGLLFFFVPGIVAFAVDFSTGAIYLPSKSSRAELKPSDVPGARVVHVAPDSLHRSGIESLLEEQTGQPFELSSPGTLVALAEPGADLDWKGLAEVLTPVQLEAFENRRVR